MCERCYEDTMKRNAKKHAIALSTRDSAPEGMAVCFRCKKCKPIVEFTPNPETRRPYYREIPSTTCKDCREYARQKASEYREAHPPEKKARLTAERAQAARDTRLLFLAAYGNRCNCCNETQREFLAIDHVENNGAKQRREIGNASDALYRWAKKHGFPKVLQILCHNCNVAKAFFGECPHKSFNIIHLLEKAS